MNPFDLEKAKAGEEGADAMTKHWFGRIKCFFGFHYFVLTPTIYTVKCARCGKKEYVGP